MHILVTNDDGVTAPGLAALASGLSAIGDVSVLAPDRNWSASGHVKTMHKPLRVRNATLADGRPARSATGAPSDCVALALLGLVEPAVDLVVSGINPNANLGHDVTYSGTVTAAMEAVIFGLPAIAVSTESDKMPGYDAVAAIAAGIARLALDRGLPKGVLLNVNVPACRKAEIGGIRITRQGLRVYRDELVRRLDPRGEPYYWIGGEPPDGQPDPGTDFAALEAGFVSVTPLHLDLTSDVALATLGAWDWGR